MPARLTLTLLLTTIGIFPLVLPPASPACCPAPPSGKPVVNADQTVIIIWDALTKTQHFIRQASFKSGADDFGFIVPSPTEPELSESGNDAFPYLAKLTEPEIEKRSRSSGVGCGCGSKTFSKLTATGGGRGSVAVLQDKQIGDFRARVLEASAADALVDWLKENGFAYSPEIAAWAKPYIEAGWKFTTLKVTKDDNEKAKTSVAASALRMSFKTDRPLFPYREPDSRSAAETLNATSRLLRIYFIGHARYKGEMTKEQPWTGQVAWANKLKSADRKKILELLKLPESTGPAEWWLTEFEDNWPYKVAPADVYFSRDADQSTVKRPPNVLYVASPWPTDVMACALAAFAVLPPIVRRLRRNVRRC